MNSRTAQFVTSMGIYEPIHQISMWGDFNGNGCPNTSASMIMEGNTELNNQSEDTSQGTLGASHKFDQEATKPADKVLRRLAQNREAARKSRLRKKAYVQQLETSRLKLIQLEQELEQVKQQGLYNIGGGLDTSHLGYSGPVKSDIAAFEMEYGQWVEEQDKQICELRTALNCELRTALNSHVVDRKLGILVEKGVNHFSQLFRMKATAAKADVLYLISGNWKTSVERYFLWMGGFRPSEILKVLARQLDQLTEQQVVRINNLRKSCQQAEDALSQGMEKLQQTVAKTVADGQLGEGSCINPRVTTAMDNLEALVSFVNQTDHLRKETLQQMKCILTIHQAAQGLLALGEYCQRLRTLSSLWATRPREPA